MNLTVVIVPNEASWVQSMDTSVHLVIMPVEARIVILIPFTIEPDSFSAIVLDKLFQLSIHESIISLPLTMCRTSSTTPSTSDGIVVITRPVKERIVDMEA